VETSRRAFEEYWVYDVRAGFSRTDAVEIVVPPAETALLLLPLRRL